jgi:hypothetical protein
MRNVNTTAAEKAKTRDSFNKNCSPIIVMNSNDLKTLAEVQELYPQDAKEKTMRVIVCKDEMKFEKIVGILQFKINFIDPTVKNSFGKVDPNIGDNVEVNEAFDFDEVDEIKEEDKEGDEVDD